MEWLYVLTLNLADHQTKRALLHSTVLKNIFRVEVSFFSVSKFHLNLRIVTQKNINSNIKFNMVLFTLGDGCKRDCSDCFCWFWVFFNCALLGNQGFVPKMYLLMHLNQEVMSFPCLFQTLFFGKDHNTLLI